MSKNLKELIIMILRKKLLLSILFSLMPALALAAPKFTESVSDLNVTLTCSTSYSSCMFRPGGDDSQLVSITPSWPSRNVTVKLRYASSGNKTVRWQINGSTFVRTFHINGGAYWTKWSNNNPNASRKLYISCPSGHATGLQAKEQGGYGIVDVRLICNGTDSRWATGNPNGKTLSYNYNRNIPGIATNTQGGYGIVNIASLGRFSSYYWANWLATNFNGQDDPYLKCKLGDSVKGLEIAEQYGYGVIDVRAYCSR